MARGEIHVELFVNYERVEAVLRLTGRGLTHSHIADRLHMSGARVEGASCDGS